MNPDEFNLLLQLILDKVIVVPSWLLEEFREEALKVVGGIDVNDVLFFACALAYDSSIIWSDDNNLKKQAKVKVLNTEEISVLLA